MEGLKMIPYITLILTIAGVIIGASVITLSKFGDTNSIEKCANSSYVFNVTVDGCIDPWDNKTTGTAGYGHNLSIEYYTISQSLDGEATVAEQQSTVAIIAVMVIVISLVAGVFAYMKYFA